MGYPLADLVWWFALLVVVEQLVALLLAIALGRESTRTSLWLQDNS